MASTPSFRLTPRRFQENLVAHEHELARGHQHQTHQDAGNDTCLEHIADVDVCLGSVEYHDDAGRDDGADNAGGCGDGGGEALVKTVVLHGLHLDLTQAGGVRRGGAGDACEHHTGQHVHVGQAAAYPAHQGKADVKYTLCNAAGVHQVASQNEKGHCQQREALDAADDGLGDHDQLQVVHQQSQDGGDAYREEDGEAQEEAYDKYAYDDQCLCCHVMSPPSFPVCSSPQSRRFFRSCR